MTPENKELLLQDLCARLPYGVIVKYKGHNTIKKINFLQGLTLIVIWSIINHTFVQCQV